MSSEISVLPIKGSRVAIVGNAAVLNPDYAERIDMAQLVLRFNRCQSFFDGAAGTRTNILCVSSDPLIVQDQRLVSIVEQAEQIWTLQCDEQAAMVTVAALGTHRKHTAHLGVSRYSSGFLVTKHLLFHGCRLELFGFRWNGWDCHPWDEERAIMYDWGRIGALALFL